LVQAFDDAKRVVECIHVEEVTTTRISCVRLCR
jgi:hypothetical protein